ncbi:MAG: ecdysteroid 22-kinase family protein [Gemmatimonadetes bacterium]|nr:ecdysteroid 22-kinase family protein [Gemmatimonadota bacterium]MBT8403439.1 ecdysteroid 22-kinase family protein [Gemmatimonadota bacterium]NNK64547.1 phosphotransferase [Gemmatimonadota bacterium]
MTPTLPPHFLHSIRRALGASSVEVVESLQELWSGYGHILRVRLGGMQDSGSSTAIAKYVRFPDRTRHPRGWHSSRSHERKLRSYHVESVWYRDWAARCGDECRVARLLLHEAHEDEVLILLEDLDAADFPARVRSIQPDQLRACLGWLAHFHATFMGAKPEGLWETGTYWHLATRPDELDALRDLPLKEAAPRLDALLRGGRYQTLVHGDAKLANFCFSPQGTAPSRVAAVDFQYVGGGCGMKDLAYFLGSCLDEAECERREGELLDLYFDVLRSALALQPDLDAESVEREWRALFPVAWTDFHRFLKGWSPGHWKIHSYSERVAREVLSGL